MTTIYTFNGKDITMNVVIQIRAIADIIKEEYGIDFIQALSRFYGSETYQTLRQTENAFWAESAEYIADRFFEEEEKASVKS